MGGGVCGAIFAAAGAKKLQAACDKLAPIDTGEAVITPGFNLPAKYIIHTAGPVYRGGSHGEEGLLRAAYTNSLKCAIENKCESVAFPLISSGIFGYPKEEALRVATDAIRDFISGHEIDVTLVVFDKASFAVSSDLVGAVESYIDEHYIEEQEMPHRQLIDAERLMLRDAETPVAEAADSYEMLQESIADAGLIKKAKEPAMKSITSIRAQAPAASSLDDLVGSLDEPFSATLLRLIDATGKKDSEIYNKANIDRRLFSKIRSNPGYAPSKPTILAFAIALELTLDQTEDLLERAGFALSHSRKFDVILEYFITSNQYDIYKINEILFSYDQPLLGG
jgi:O-acetyl-ADP-ribose deacetylase (regulator of RNase III)